MFKTSIDIEVDKRQEMIEILNAQLADTFDMVSLIKQAHWNVKGAQFIALHQLYDEMAQSLLAYVDMIAERATALGGTALGTVRMAAVSSLYWLLCLSAGHYCVTGVDSTMVWVYAGLSNAS